MELPRPAKPTDTHRRLADALAGLEGIVAIALGGSAALGLGDRRSDSDLYAFWRSRPAGRSARHAALAPLADGGAVREDTAWGLEDHFTVDGQQVEVVYLDLDALDVDAAYRVGLDGLVAVTAFLHTVAACLPLRDDQGVLAEIRARLSAYPEATRARLLTSVPVALRTFLTHLEVGQAREDWPYVTQRRADLQAAWFTLLFAANRRFHPGEKRLLTHAETLGMRVPNQVQRWTAVAALPADDPMLVEELRRLVDDVLALAAA